MFEALTAEQLAAIEERDKVLPLDHEARMLGLIAWMIGRYFGMDGDLDSVCMPWLDQPE